MIVGQKVVTVSSQDSVQLFSDSQFQEIAGRAFRNGDFIGVMNGDGIANKTHLDGVTYQAPNFYVVFNGGLSGSLRVTYLIVLAA